MGQEADSSSQAQKKEQGFLGCQQTGKLSSKMKS
jgi:hypothetical protein